MSVTRLAADKTTGYAPVNGLEMYYEVEGSGDPLVFIPPAFQFAGLKTFPLLAAKHTVITMDLQGHGRTADIAERPLSIEQHAKDVAALLKHLGIEQADFLGESYGGCTAAMLAVRHPALVRRVAMYSATFGPPQESLDPGTVRFDHPPSAATDDIRFQRENYSRVAPDPAYWPAIYDKLAAMRWNGFTRAELQAIESPVLIVVGDHDFVRIEHAVETMKRIPRAELAVIPDASHFCLSSEPDRVIPIVKHFFEKPEKRLPIATSQSGYQPGITR